MCATLSHVCLGTWDSGMESQEVPPSDRVVSGALRKGPLHKLSGRGWLFSGTWKRRFCVLTSSALYFYEKEHSVGRDKTCGVLHLEYYDVCEEDPKRPFTFFMDSSVKAFFDNRQQFSAENAEEFREWTDAVRLAIEGARMARKKRAQDPTLEGIVPPDYLVGAHKDRVKGPQGRRPPQRKSLMPASRSNELDLDGRQRSVSLSTPQRPPGAPDLPPVTEGKWLSLSMEEVEQDKDSPGAQRSSSAVDIPQQEGPPRRAGGPKGGNLLFQHAALTRELEMRLKAGMASRSPCREEEETKTEDKVEDKDQVEDTLLQVKAALKEVEQLKSELRRTLSEVERAKQEYDVLIAECRGQLQRLRKEGDALQEEDE